jgi:short-subunit dehydrogenase
MPSSPQARSIVITGASAGLGAALAHTVAAPGVVLGLTGRNAQRLDEVAQQCRARGAEVVVGQFDVTDPDAVTRWMAEYDEAHPIDLLIANAGVFTGHGANRQMETHAEIVWQLRTNIEGVTNTINAALPGLRRRRKGRIAIIASLAALQPLADAPAYSASKAGVAAYGEALREFLIEDGVDVTLVFPGHIDTAQAAAQVGGLVAVSTAEQAAKTIVRGLARGRSFIAFPLRLLALIWLGRLVHWRLRAAFGHGFRFHIRK